jgi:hypothetical protein
MVTMRTTLPAALLCAFSICVGVAVAAPPKAKPSPSPSPTAKATTIPEIYHTTVRPVCSALRTKIGPAVGMLLQNNQLIAKSKPMFKEFATAQFNDSQPQKSMTLLHMENLVTPLANNVLAIQKLLEDPTVFPPNSHTDDDKRSNELKSKLLASLADQQAALDIIDGFVETQNLADMQHEGFGYIGAISQQDTTGGKGGAPSNSIYNVAPTADPLHPQPFDNTVINAGLPTNPYELDLTRIPGLALGYNPVNNLRQGVEFTETEGGKRQDTLAKSVQETVQLCGGHDQVAAPAPSSSPKP